MNTYRTVGAQRLHAARVVVLNAAARLSLQVFGLLDETHDLPVLTNAGGEFGPQMDQVFLKGCRNVRSEKHSKKKRAREAKRFTGKKRRVLQRRKTERKECVTLGSSSRPTELGPIQKFCC